MATPFGYLLFVDFSPDELFGRFPAFFSRLLPALLPMNAVLIDPVGNVNTLKVKKLGNHCYFTEGWRHFGNFYGIIVGAWIRLVYVRTNTFDITIRDYTGIEWVYPPMPESLDVGGAGCANHFPTGEPVLLVSNRNLFKFCCVKWVSFTEFTGDTMTMPEDFYVQALPNQDAEICIVDEFGNRWPCLLQYRGPHRQHCVLTRGWARFCRSKGLQQDQQIMFGVTQPSSNILHYLPVV